MPRSPAQSDFVVSPTTEAVEVEVELHDVAGVVKLPKAVARSNEAGATTTKLVMTFTWLMLLALVLLCAIGPHIPSGE